MRLSPRTWFALCGLLFLGYAHGQATHMDSVYWDTIMNARIEQVLRAELDPFSANVHRKTTEFGSQDLKVNTIETAILLLGDGGIERDGVFALYDLLDSAAAHFFRQGTPIILISGDAGTRGTEWFMERERDLGVWYVYSGLGCVRDRGQGNGEELFNLRTEILLHPEKHPKANKEVADIRKRFVEDERHYMRMERAISKEIRQ
jgi:hypothetical protein